MSFSSQVCANVKPEGIRASPNIIDSAKLLGACLFCGVEKFFRPGYQANLVAEWLPSLEGVVEKLENGGKVADVGCGYGASTIVMAKAFPKSSFVGFDFHEPSVDREALFVLTLTGIDVSELHHTFEIVRLDADGGLVESPLELAFQELPRQGVQDNHASASVLSHSRHPKLRRLLGQSFFPPSDTITR